MSSSEQSTTLFRNVRVFDGRSPVLSNGSNVLVRGSTIESISTQSIDPGHSEHRVEIDGGGRVLMPGLIDAHWHAMLASMPIAAMRTADIGYLNLVAGEQATRTLHRGFTTVRDAGGAIVRAQAGDRRRNCCGAPDLSVRRVHLTDVRSRGLPHATRSATRDLWPPQSG
jgi:imidazolonepropionase-like amidohydrolase